MVKKIFDGYAKYYDLIYKNKNYVQESNYIHKILKLHSSKNNILEIGCGTGMHAICLSKYNYKIFGIDISDKMIKIANRKSYNKKKLKFKTKDVLKLNFKNKFDTAISMFHVINYLTTKKQIIKAFKNINKSLKDNGLLLFDFWYAPAVRKNKLSKRAISFTTKNLDITKKVTPKIYSKNTAKINIKISLRDKKNGKEKHFIENHKVRYFEINELKQILKLSGFNILNSYEWLKRNKPKAEAWSGLIVAKKNNYYL